MPTVRSGGAKKWVNRAGMASEDYKAGVQNPRKDWAESTAAASDNYKQAIQQSIAKDSFKKGVQKSGSATWLRGAIEKGAARYPSGVAASEGKYQQGIEPYLNVIESTNLPPRYPKGDPRNIERVKALANALHNKKTSM